LPGAGRSVIAEVTARLAGVRHPPSLGAERDVFTEVTASVKVCHVFTIGDEPVGRPIRNRDAGRRTPH